MRLTGCDLHASQQSIAMLDRDTGAVVEKTLKHDGEAVGILRLPSAAGRRRDRSDGLDGMVSPVDGGAGDRLSRRASGGDSEGGVTPADTRSARCRAVAAAAGGGSVSDDLDAVDRAARSAGPPLAPPSMGPDADARPERIARDRDGARPCGGTIRCGIARARRCSRRCRWRRTPRIIAVSSRRCISTWMRTSIDSASESRRSPTSVLERRCS
jgi:hypothetical protein